LRRAIEWDGFNSDECTGGTEKRRKSAMTHFLRRGASGLQLYIQIAHRCASQKSDAALAKHCNYTRAALNFLQASTSLRVQQKKLMNQPFFASKLLN